MAQVDLEAGDATQDLAQFEPDPDGLGAGTTETPADAPVDDPQWVVWQDAGAEADWAAAKVPHLLPLPRG
jgi:hypothetical protein